MNTAHLISEAAISYRITKEMDDDTSNRRTIVLGVDDSEWSEKAFDCE